MDLNQFVAARYGSNHSNTWNTISSRLPIPVRIIPIPLKTKPKPLTSRTQISRGTNKSTLVSVSSSLSLRRSSKLLAAVTTDAIAGEYGENLAGEEDPSPEGLLPRHVAVIMDGNGRWAQKRGLSAGAGHLEGARSLTRLVKLCCRWRIEVLTVFAFSAENWDRSKVEVEFLMSLFERRLKSEQQCFMREGIRVSAIGDLSKLPNSLKNVISHTQERTKHNTRLHLIVAISYSGKYDVMQACRSIAQKTRDGVIAGEDIDEALIERELETNCTTLPCPDLLIRTGGEVRVSNFMLWQLAYTELFFARSLWPDFGESEFVEALASFQQRQRRFGVRDS